MTKEEFDELLKIIGEKRTAHARAIKNKGTLPNPKGRLNRYIANGIYFAGYRKADEVRRETAREILRFLRDLGGCGAGDDFIKGWDAAIDGAYKDISRKYGVEVEDGK